jgi:hypothetical protein
MDQRISPSGLITRRSETHMSKGTQDDEGFDLGEALKKVLKLPDPDPELDELAQRIDGTKQEKGGA